MSEKKIVILETILDREELDPIHNRGLMGEFIRIVVTIDESDSEARRVKDFSIERLSEDSIGDKKWDSVDNNASYRHACLSALINNLYLQIFGKETSNENKQ